MAMVLMILILFSSWLAYFLFTRRKSRDTKFSRYKLPPGPWQLPIVGYLPWIDKKKPHETLTKLARTYGPVCGLRMGSVYTIILSDPRLVRQAFAKDVYTGRAPLYLTHGIMQGYGLICAEGDLWKDQRKFVTSCLRNFGVIKYGPKRNSMERKILDAANECLMKLGERSKNGPFDPLETLHHCLGNLINRIVFGKTYEENDPVWKWLRHLQEEGVKEIGVAGPLNFLPFLRFVPHFGRTMRSLIDGKLKTHQLYLQILEEYKSAASRGTSEEDNEHFLGAFHEEASKACQQEPNYFTEEQMCHLLADLFGAGTDTTLTTIRWFLLFMAAYPEQQEKVHQEMDRVLSVDGEDLLLGKRSALPQLEAAIAEVQRMRSVTPLGIPHGTTEDTQIGDYDVPKGTMIVPLQWAIHTDPIYWPDPLEFNPDRFIDAETNSFRKPEAFIPFQTGKRVCVGDELARMILFLFCGGILRNFTISSAADVKVDLEGECGITLLPKTQTLIFEERHRAS